jgi:hypothetical protein
MPIPRATQLNLQPVMMRQLESMGGAEIELIRDEPKGSRVGKLHTIAIGNPL